MLYDRTALFLRRFDLYVNPRSTETFGIGTVEALVMGVPVVACASGPSYHDHIVRPEVTGLVVDCSAGGGGGRELGRAIVQMMTKGTESGATLLRSMQALVEEGAAEYATRFDIGTVY
jgi:glycosyltransferase involved in cell wall biosynthesis